MGGKTPPKWHGEFLNDNPYKGSPGSNKPAFFVLHETDGRKGGDLEVLRGRTGTKVSVQFYITRAGEIFYLVSIDRAAWHAGVSAYKGHSGLNDESIGAEMEHLPGQDWPEAQLDALDNLILWVDGTLGRKLSIVTHAQIAMPRGRKVDPERFVELGDYIRFRDHDPSVHDEYIGAHNAVDVHPYHGVAVCDGVEVRKAPNMGAPVVGHLPKGAVFTVTAILKPHRLGTWGKVRGWVHDDDLAE